MSQRQIKKQVHGQAHTIRVDSGPGWRTVLEDELREVLTAPLQAYKFVPEIMPDDEGITVSNLDFRQLLELPLRLLTASEILWQIDTKHVGSFGEFEDFIEGINWDFYIQPQQAVKIRVQSFRSGLYHEGKLEKISRAILASKGHEQTDPKYMIRIEQKENRCTAYLALSQEPLFRRAYKIDYSHPAPLQEHLAAAAIRFTWGKEVADLIYVPFAGSGTMVLESWLYAHHPPLDLWRPFKSLESIPAFPEATWKFIKSKLNQTSLKALSARAVEWDVQGVDVLKSNIAHAEKNWPSLAGVWDVEGVDVLQDKCPAGAKNIFIPMNPPYGLRLDEDTQELYLKLGKWLHRAFSPQQHRFGFVLLADSKAFHAFEKGVGAQYMNGIMSFTQGGQHIRCVSFDIPAAE